MITDLSQLDLEKQYTYQDYLKWHFTDRVELIKGWIRKMSPAPSRKHQRFSLKLSFVFQTYFQNKKCGIYTAPFDVRLFKNTNNQNEITTVVQPDISIICDASKLDDAGCIGTPDLIVEILSPYSFQRDYHEKMELYANNEVPEYWIANPDSKSVEIFFLKNAKYESKGIYVYGNEPNTFNSIQFPDLSIDLETLYSDDGF